MIAVITCARPDGVSYLTDTIRDIDSSASTARILIVDDGEPVSAPSHWEIARVPVAPERSISRPDWATWHAFNKWATWHAFKLAAQRGEDLILFEDDVRLCKNAVRYMERFQVPAGVAFVSLYNPYSTVDTPLGIWRASMRLFSYCQGLKVPLSTCQAFADGYQEMAGNLRRGGSDDCMQDFGTARGWQYGIHQPSLVQHVGAVSSISKQGLEGCRQSKSFPGVDFDAMTLRPYLYD